MKKRSATDRIIFQKRRAHSTSSGKSPTSSMKEKIDELQRDNEKLSEACLNLMKVKDALMEQLRTAADNYSKKEKTIEDMKAEITVLKADQFIQSKLQRQLEKQYQESVTHYTELFQRFKKLQHEYINIQKVEKRKSKKKKGGLKQFFGINNSVSEDGYGGLSEAVVSPSGSIDPSLLVHGSSLSKKDLEEPSKMGWECYPFKNVRRWDQNDIMSFLRDAGIFKSYYQKLKKYKVKNLSRLFTLLGEDSNISQKRALSGSFEDFEVELFWDGEGSEESEGEEILIEGEKGEKLRPQEEEEEVEGEEVNEDYHKKHKKKRRKSKKEKKKKKVKRSKYSLPLQAKDFFGKPITRVQSRLFLINIIYLQDIYNQDELFDSKFPKTLFKISTLPDFCSLPMEDVSKIVRRLITKSVIQENLMLQEGDGSRVPIKLIMLEESSFHHDIKIENIPVMEYQGVIPTRLSNPPYVTGLILGKWIISFGGEKTGLVIPRKLRAGDDVLREATVLGLGGVSRRVLRDRIAPICDHVIEYTANLSYHRTERNCQHFISDILKELKISTNHLSGQIRDYLKFMKKCGRDTHLPLQFRPVAEWSHQDCLAWLELLGLSKSFSSKFEELKITGQHLVKYEPKLNDHTHISDGVFGVGVDISSSNDSNEEKALNILVKKLRVHIFHFQQYFGKTRKPLCYNPGMGMIVEKIMDSPKSMEMPLSQIQKHAVVLSHPALLAKTYLPIKNLVEDVRRSKCLKVKLIITEIQGRPLSEVVNQIISRVLVKVRYFKESDFGLFHSALLVGNWYLEWTDNELVIPKKLQSGGAFFLLDLAPIPFVSSSSSSSSEEQGMMEKKMVERRLKEIRKKLLEVIHKWNVKIRYSRTKHNCQHFVDDVLGVLGIERTIDKNTCVGRYVNSIRKKGVANVYFEPDSDFINFFLGKVTSGSSSQPTSPTPRSSGSNHHSTTPKSKTMDQSSSSPKDNNNNEELKVLIEEEEEDDQEEKEDERLKKLEDDLYYGLKHRNLKKSKFKKSMVKKSKVAFNTHSDLDEYVHNLLCFPGMSMVRFSSRFESEYQLLKSFDRAFWLRRGKYPNSSKYAPSKKNAVYGTGAFRCGCPFHSPFESKSFQGNKIMVEELRSYREEEERRWRKEHPNQEEKKE